jgi:hypothetical protein
MRSKPPTWPLRRVIPRRSITSNSSRRISSTLRRISPTRAITPQHEIIGLQQRSVEVSFDSSNIESPAEGIAVREIRWNDKTRGLSVQQRYVRMSYVGGGEVRYLGRRGVERGDAGAGEGDVLLEPEEVCWDGRA